jgi:hypothetical protein
MSSIRMEQLAIRFRGKAGAGTLADRFSPIPVGL